MPISQIGFAEAIEAKPLRKAVGEGLKKLGMVTALRGKAGLHGQHLEQHPPLLRGAGLLQEVAFPTDFVLHISGRGRWGTGVIIHPLQAQCPEYLRPLPPSSPPLMAAAVSVLAIDTIVPSESQLQSGAAVELRGNKGTTVSPVIFSQCSLDPDHIVSNRGWR